MMSKPTYSAVQIKEMVSTFDLDYDTFKTIVDIVEEEIELYSPDEIEIIKEASMIAATRSMFNLSLKFLK